MGSCDRCEELQFVIDELTGNDDPFLMTLPISRRQRHILGRMLLRPGIPVQRPQLLAASCAHDPSGNWPFEHSIDALVRRMRLRLKGGVEITTHPGVGYSAIRT